MPSHLSVYLKEQIVALWEEGKTVSKLLTTVESEGRRTLRATVWMGISLENELWFEESASFWTKIKDHCGNSCLYGNKIARRR